MSIHIGYAFAFVLTSVISTWWLSRRLWPRDEVRLDPKHELYPVGLPEMSDEMKAELRQSLAELVAKKEAENVVS